MRLLLIEDDPHLSELIPKALRAKGFAVDTCELADEACCALKDGIFDTVILDLGLPDHDGMTVLQEMRQAGNATPVLILTSRDGLKDRVNGLNAGADDYVLKPFEMEELLARIKALLRRPGGALGMTLTAGNVVLDTVSREIRIGGEVADLSRRELSVMEHLMRRLEGMVAKELPTRSHSSFSWSRKRPAGAIPALLTTISMPPNASMAIAGRAATESPSSISHCLARTLPG